MQADIGGEGSDNKVLESVTAEERYDGHSASSTSNALYTFQV